MLLGCFESAGKFPNSFEMVDHLGGEDAESTLEGDDDPVFVLLLLLLFV